MVTEPHILEEVDLRKLSIQQMNAIDMLVTGSSDKEVAEKVGVDRSTVTRWRNYHPAFIAELNAQREAVWGAAKEKLRSLMPDAVDVVSEAIRDRENPDRVKVALELIRSVKMNESVTIMPHTTEADKLIEGWTRERYPTFGLDVPRYQIEGEEMEIQAKLHGMTPTEYYSMLDEHEKEQRRLKKEAKKAAKQEVVDHPDKPIITQGADATLTDAGEGSDNQERSSPDGPSKEERAKLEEPMRYDPAIYDAEKRSQDKGQAQVG